MGKRKAKNKTLTKIDLSTLRLKPAAVSQHAAHDGTRITTAVNPVRAPRVTPSHSLAFDFGPGGLDGDFEEEEEEEEEEGEEGEDVSKGYYVARVFVFFTLRHGQ